MIIPSSSACQQKPEALPDLLHTHPKNLFFQKPLRKKIPTKQNKDKKKKMNLKKKTNKQANRLLTSIKRNQIQQYLNNLREKQKKKRPDMSQRQLKRQ